LLVITFSRVFSAVIGSHLVFDFIPARLTTYQILIFCQIHGVTCSKNVAKSEKWQGKLIKNAFGYKDHCAPK